MNPAKRKIWRLRELMRERGLDGYLIPDTDPNLGENKPEHWCIIKWLTGFSGSSSVLLVTKSFAGLWTDSRYFIQAEKELEGSGIQLMKINVKGSPSPDEWLGSNFRKGGLLGFDSRLISESLFRKYMEAVRSRDVSFDTGADLISDIWDDRPALPSSIVYEHSIEYAGETRESKIGRTREEMKYLNLDFILLISCDEIMWLLNIRAADIPFSPLMISYAIVSMEQILLFTFENRIPHKLAAEFDSHGIVVLPYDEINAVLSTLPAEASIRVAPGKTPVSIFRSVNSKADLIEGESIVSGLKAIKNSTELSGIRNSMIRDGVALTRFFIWLYENIGSGQLTERSIMHKLREIRLLQANCTGESFQPIIAWNEHAALPHYNAENEPDTQIRGKGILLIDSGGQYLDGTTDMTRCIAFGEAAPSQKRDFTLVLKGNIALARARFPEGTKGIQLDILARKSLWDNAINYGHGSGHGVGYFLNVHEGPHSISTSAQSQHSSLKPGMIVSDEPAVYRKGKYGLRIENILAVTNWQKSESDSFYAFEVLSLCFIDNSLVEKSLLDTDEINWYNNYQALVFKSLRPWLSPEEADWLKEMTKEI